ncbi:hypothetical protein CHLRE_07g328450v5 [Chlamydomonas reinhardtii]|uniref:Chromatin modification-related protein MEAF6 n=1 Tax=Chlamydomonas reinhardtii TaxID=3055 RepID=A8IHH3_CHLRE|nr:uncharacterized protein CHLRE_07g328450v5 [Chlamydomonas reinhardtii]PNW80757.1 hypothetical protein CHLRE_07g328450v5 [Chlamydomonas reinhardtii]|eukprot:XP_001690646.1 predicted protein [Chlamydomonas reinhardtii]
MVGAVADAGGTVDLVELQKKRKELADQLRKCETQIHQLETQYLEMANPQGNALRGYEGLLSSMSAAAAAEKKGATFRGEDRIFSGSSTTGRGGGGA